MSTSPSAVPAPESLIRTPIIVLATVGVVVSASLPLSFAIRTCVLRLPPSLGPRRHDHLLARLRCRRSTVHVREQVELTLQVEHALRPLRRLGTECLRLLLCLSQLLGHLPLPL